MDFSIHKNGIGQLELTINNPNAQMLGKSILGRKYSLNENG